MSQNVVPPIERAEIIAEAKQNTLHEIARRSKSISDLPPTDDFSGKKIELSSGESIDANLLASKIQNDAGPYWDD